MNNQSGENRYGITKGRFIEAFEKLDEDKDGVLSEEDLDKAVTKQSLDLHLAELVAVLKSELDDIKALHEKGRFERKDGITVADIRALERVLLETPEDLSNSDVHSKKFERKTDEPKDPAKLAKTARKTIQRVRTICATDLHLYKSTNDPIASIKLDAINQGSVGNCILLAALGAVVATNPQIVLRMLQDNNDNTYTVTFPGARTRPITIDRPTTVELAIYARSSDWGIWPAVIEKAYGVYLQEIAFSPKPVAAENTDCPQYWAEVFELLTGQKGKMQLFSEIEPEKLKSILTSAFKERRAVTAASNSSIYKHTLIAGIPTNHAYSVIDWDSQLSKITLRNPWGSEPGSEPQTELGEPLDGNLDGIFTMDFDHFLLNFCLLHYEEWGPDDACSVLKAVDTADGEVNKHDSSDKDGIRTFIRISGGLALVLVALVLSLAFVDSLSRAYSSKTWPLTAGKVVKIGHRVEPSSSGINSDWLEYTYTVSNATYTASIPLDVIDVLIGVKLDYPLGQAVSVYYNPNNPKDSCLQTGLNPTKVLHWVYFIFWALLLGLTGIIFLLSDNRIFEPASIYARAKTLNRKPNRWYRRLLARWELFWTVYP